MGMWVNIALQDMNFDNIMYSLKTLYELTNDTLILSFYDNRNYKISEYIIRKILNACNELNIPCTLGPHFLDESFIIQDRIVFKKELYLATLSEKIMWYISNYRIPDEVNKIALLDGFLGIDPLIIKQKSKDLEKNIEYYFLYDGLIVMEIPNLLPENYHFIRIRNKKGDRSDNNN